MSITASDWNVFIEGPPHGQSRPEHVLKYLARYLTGGPISDRRIIRDEDGRVTFWARSKDKAKGNPSRPFPLPGKEFVRRWAMHILPKGYTRSRQFGGYHGRKRAAYLASCRALLAKSLPAGVDSVTRAIGTTEQRTITLTCPRCEVPLRCLDRQRRPSWKLIFTSQHLRRRHALLADAPHLLTRPTGVSARRIRRRKRLTSRENQELNECRHQKSSFPRTYRPAYALPACQLRESTSRHH